MNSPGTFQFRRRFLIVSISQKKFSDPAQRRSRPGWLASTLAFMAVTLAGCQKLPSRAQLQQYQVENEKLLGELRSQKKRADDLASSNAQLAERLDEAERHLAQLPGSRSNNRITSDSFSSRRSAIDLPSGLGSPIPDPKSLSSPASFGRSTKLESGQLDRNQDAPRWKPIPKRP